MSRSNPKTRGRRAQVSGCLLLLVLGGCLPRHAPTTSPGGAESPMAMRRLAVNCPPVDPGKFYRFVAGVDACLTSLHPDERTALNDPFGRLLKRNEGGAGPWPAAVSAVVTAVESGVPGAGPAVSYVVGEGSQVHPARTGPAGNRDLRYVLTWNVESNTPAIYFNSRPDATPPIFMEVIGWDPAKKAFNYYRYISNEEVVPGDPDRARTWTYAGDTRMARTGAAVGQGCFSCHRNGGLNMKELKVPWNNWRSQAAQIPARNVPPAMASDPLFLNATNAENLQSNVFEPVMAGFMEERVKAAISSTGQVTDPPALLRPLITNTTVNFTSSQVVARSAAPPLNLPPTFAINDDMLGAGHGLGLGYQTPQLTMPVPKYRDFIAAHDYRLVNGGGRAPRYTWGGDNFFATFYPEPAFEDVVAVQQLWQRSVVSQQFAAAVLMVDYPNPVFSGVRDTLLRYSAQITTGIADGRDIPNRFAELVRSAAAEQPPCTSPDLTRCPAEQQFTAYWEIVQQADWKVRLANILNPYLAAVARRMDSNPEDYINLARSRQEQFQNYPGICNLYEFDLMLPCSRDSGTTWYRMNSDGTISPQARTTCPTRPADWQDPCRIPSSL
jgi:hypothetical protein